MRGIKPNAAVWKRVNDAVMGENAATVLITMISGMLGLLVQSGACANEDQARAHLAAMLLSPDNGAKPGSLLPLLKRELDRLADGKWIV